LNVVKFDDLIAPLKSGVVNVNGLFTMSYGNLEPVSLQAAGGTLTINTTALPGMTQMNVADLGGGTFEVSGNGGFETTTFRGFSAFFVTSPDGAKLVLGPQRRPDCTLVRRGADLSVLGTLRNDSIKLTETESGLFVDCGAPTEIGVTGIKAVRAEVAGGNDQVSARLASIVDLAVFLGDGNDRLTVDLALPSVRTVGVSRGILDATVRVTVDAGAGNDVAAIKIVGHAAALLPQVDMGNGNDELTVFLDGYFGLLLWVGNLGAGNDPASLTHRGESGESAIFEMEAGEGHDQVSMVLDAVPRDGPSKVLVDLFGSVGNDELTLLLSDELEMIAAALVDGGKGKDRALVSPGVRTINCETVIVN
jgi:hypothetical protein